MVNRANHPMYRDRSDDELNSISPNSEINDQQLVRRHNEELARQDDTLDEIYLASKGLTSQAHAINNEWIDEAHHDLERGEARARAVNAKKTKLCKLYGLIATLVLVEIILTVAQVPFFKFDDE